MEKSRKVSLISTFMSILGIPRNLVFNLIGWVVLMALFAILRRAAGNYGRWALVRKDNDNEAKWTQLFYAPDDVSVENDHKAENNKTFKSIMVKKILLLRL